MEHHSTTCSSISRTGARIPSRWSIYARIGFSEALRRLAKIFPAGSALPEIERRKGARLDQGEIEAQADAGVIDDIAGELLDGRGIGLKLRPYEADPTDSSDCLAQPSEPV
jgi:intracellular multiplication protein IcmB